MTATYRTVYHRDRTVTLWDVYAQQWTRTASPSNEVYSSLTAPERVRIMAHVGAA